MNQEEFFNHIQWSFTDGLELVRRKNTDYSGSADPFKNFRSAEVIGVGVDKAILVRILDKIARIGNLLDTEAQVKDESIDDTLIDAANYLLILKAYLYDERTKKQKKNGILARKKKEHRR